MIDDEGYKWVEDTYGRDYKTNWRDVFKRKSVLPPIKYHLSFWLLAYLALAFLLVAVLALYLTL